MLSKHLASVLAVLALASSYSQAALIDAPLPGNPYIVHNGLKWAWASPLPAVSGWGEDYDLDLSYQGQFGWRLPTAAELALAPTAQQFLFRGANVPLNDADPVSGAYFTNVDESLTGAAACAAPYFTKALANCDWLDGAGQPGGAWAGQLGSSDVADQLVVQAVPEPETYALMGLGVVGLIASRRRRRTR